MILENVIEVALMFMIFIFGLVSIIGAIVVGEENKRLRRKIARLENRIAQRKALDNIKVANEFYNTKE